MNNDIVANEMMAGFMRDLAAANARIAELEAVRDHYFTVIGAIKDKAVEGSVSPYLHESEALVQIYDRCIEALKKESKP